MAAPPTAYVSRAGEVTVRRADTETVIATVRPALFEATWQYRGVSAGSMQAQAAGRTEGVIRATGGKSPVRVRGEVRPAGERIQFRYEFMPEGPLTVNSVHVSVNLPVRSWVGARFSAPGVAGGTVPETAKSTALISGNLKTLTLEKGSARVRVESEGSPILLQDNRVFGGGELEIRIGRQSGEGRSWAAGQKEEITFTLDLGESVRVEEEAPVTLGAGPDWIPLDLKLDIERGSALDLSSLNEAPAGKHGWVVARPDGHFGFERGKGPVRFYGVNLCFSANYPEKAEADRLAERLARAGYNTVRIHHFEGDLVDPKASDSLTFRPENLDRLDYLVSALKGRGMYLKTDLFISRPVRPSEAPGDNFKMALLVSNRALQNWEAFSGKLLRHVNPYTKLAWKDDPAIAWLCVVNEGNGLNYLGSLAGELRDLFEAEWRTWLREQYKTDAALAAAWGDAQATLAAPLPKGADSSARGRDAARFISTLHERSFARMARFLREEVKTRALLTDLNGWTETPAFMAARTQLDWVDNHFYWDHPHFLEGDWRLPSQGGSGGGSAVAAGGAGPDRVAATRLWGKPFSVSEYNYSAPNPYRAEGGLLMGAAAALQDWDAVWRFAYSHSRTGLVSPEPLNYFDMARDPAGMSSEWAAVLLFRRGDMSPAPSTAVVSSKREDLLRGTGERVPTARIWSAMVGRQVTEPGRAAGSTTPSRPAGGSPQPVTLDPEKGVLRIDSPRFAGIVGPAGTSQSVGPLSAAIEGARAVVWIASLDEQPVGKSRRMLLVHTTDVQNTGMRYSGPDRRVLLDWGGLPHLARAGKARVSLAHDGASGLRAWRLDISGKRLGSVPVRVEGGKAVLELSTRAEDGKASLYYEVVGQ
jgi:hypothetical protein